MLDDMLFERGHILVQIDGQVDDYDNLIPDFYFDSVLKLSGEVVDSNGSDYHLDSLEDDKFVIDFTVYETEFETNSGDCISFNELNVQCAGYIIQNQDCDILLIASYDVISVD